MNYEEIEKYLHNGMDETERKAFELELAGNPALAAEVKLYLQTEQQLLASAHATAGEAQLQQQLAALNKTYFGTKAKAPVVPINRRKWLLRITSSAAAVLLCVFLLQPLFTTQKTNEELYAENAVYSLASIRNADGSTGNTNAADLYNNKKYKEALAILEPIGSNNTDTLLAIAVCHLETSNSSKALEMYNRIAASASANPDAVQKEVALAKVSFYKALLYLKQGDKNACRNALKQIPKGTDYFNNAAKLLKEL